MKSRCLFVAGLLAFLPLGCMTMPANTLEDVDGDGFPDLEVPEGVDDSTKLGIEVVNDITRAQIINFFLSQAQGAQGLGGVANLVKISLTFDFTFTYPDGQEVTRREVRELGRFDFRFSGACPDTITAEVTINATAPIIGVIPTPEIPPIVLSADGSTGDGAFECDRVFSLTAMFDDATGQPIVDFEITDF